MIDLFQRRSGEIGRRAGLKIQSGATRVWVRIPPPAPTFSKLPGFTQVRDFTSDAVLLMLFVTFCKGFVTCGEICFDVVSESFDDIQKILDIVTI
jgi:hypothetical protein